MWFFLMLIFWIFPAILNPILYYIRFKLYDQKDWEDWINKTKNERFFKFEFTKSMSVSITQIRDIKLTLGGFWDYVKVMYGEFKLGWYPVMALGVFLLELGYILYPAVKPIIRFFKKVGDYISNIPV